MDKSTVPSRDCKITLQSVLDELEMLDLSPHHFLTRLDVWLLIPESEESWSVYVGHNPSRVGSVCYLGRSCISPVDLTGYNKETLEIIAAELIDDLTENFTDDELPELLRD